MNDSSYNKANRPICQIDRYFLAVVVAVIAISALPTMIHLTREYGPLLRRRLIERFGKGWARLDPDTSAE